MYKYQQLVMKLVMKLKKKRLPQSLRLSRKACADFYMKGLEMLPNLLFSYCSLFLFAFAVFTLVRHIFAYTYSPKCHPQHFGWCLFGCLFQYCIHCSCYQDIIK